jgi:hypothetical protein
MTGRSLHETATLHFDLSHLSLDDSFALHAGARRYELAAHTRSSLAQARRRNAALALVPDHRVTHFAGPVRLPGNCPLLLRITAPKAPSGGPARLAGADLAVRAAAAPDRRAGAAAAADATQEGHRPQE